MDSFWRARLAAIQKDLSRHGLYSASWHDGEALYLIASTDALWVDGNMHDAAHPVLVVYWEPPKDAQPEPEVPA